MHKYGTGVCLTKDEDTFLTEDDQLAYIYIIAVLLFYVTPTADKV